MRQAPVAASLPSGESSLSYSFHARYVVSARRARHVFANRRGAEYPIIGRGNQTLAYRAHLHEGSATRSEDHVIDWHGSGAWTRHSGDVAVLNVFGRQFSLIIDLNLGPGTIPLAVSSEDTYVDTTDEGTCILRGGQDGSRIWVDDPCAGRVQSVNIPVRTRVNTYALLSDENFRGGVCRGPRVPVREFNGFCGVAKPNGRLRWTHTTVWAHPTDYPFRPWEDEFAAGQAQDRAGLSYGATGLGVFGLRTTYTIDLRPGRP